MKRILIVNDDEEDIEQLEEILSGDYELVVAETSHEAIRLAEEENFDLMLVDVYLPGIDGFDIIRVIQAGKEKMEMPFIFITSERDNEVELECIEIGADDIINKPFNASLVKNKIKKVIDSFIYRENLEDTVERSTERIEQIVTDSKIDKLTGVYNRAGGYEIWRDMIEDHDNITIFMVDIDNFKRINDTFGHVAGDACLTSFGKLLNEFKQDGDLAVRVGGDEFIFVVPKRLTEKRIREIAKAFDKKCIENFNQLGYRDIASVSAGVVRYPENGLTIEELYKKADKALYTVKLNGKHGVHIYDEFIDETSRESNVEMKNVIYTVEGHLDTRDGAYQVEYNDFKKIYNFIMRYMRRYVCNAQVVVFTLGMSQIVELDKLKKAMTALESAITGTLRCSDIVTKYNSSQYIVLLMNIKESDCKKVIDRIRNAYKYYLIDGDIELSYELETMGESDDESESRKKSV